MEYKNLIDINSDNVILFYMKNNNRGVINMKKAIIGLDGGGSNLRMIIIDAETEQELYYTKISTGTNLSTVPNREEALNNIKEVIKEGFCHIPNDYCLMGIGLSSAGTEIKEDKISLEQALNEVVEDLKKISNKVKSYPPRCFVTNDIDILLHSADIAIVAGTGTVAAVKYKDVKPYDNNWEIPQDYIIEKFDGNGQYIGDKGAGYWIGQEVLKRVAEMEGLGGYINSNGEFVETIYEEDLYLRKLVFEKIFEEAGLPEEQFKKALQSGLKSTGAPEFVSLVYDATSANGKPFDRAKVGNLFAKIADEAAIMGDTAANDILKHASIELYKNIRAAYQRGGFDNKEICDLLLSGSVLVHSKIVRYFLETVIKEKHPNIYIKVNDEEPVLSTARYVKNILKNEKTLEIDTDEELEK